MDTRTLEALKASIKHWEDNVEKPEKATLGPKACALCRLFNPVNNADIETDPCSGCPVMDRTKQQYCYGSPYWDAQDAEDNGDEDLLLDSMKAELDFLRSLLPASEEV